MIDRLSYPTDIVREIRARERGRRERREAVLFWLGFLAWCALLGLAGAATR